MKQLILFCLFQLLLFSVTGQEKRLALVIGNANYEKGALKNPVNDALLMKETFEKLGFDVVLETDIETNSEFVGIIDNYNNLRKGYSIGFIYYAGHAVQIGGLNYMLPTKEKFETESNIKYKGVNISIFTDEWKNPYSNEVNVLILDACRNNPFEKQIYGTTRNIGDNDGLGLAEIDRGKQPTGSIVAFSTAAGQTASDGLIGSKNSFYCQSLSKNLQLSDVSLRNIFGKVSKEIYKQTNQYPEVSDKMFDVDFFLKKSTYIDQINQIDSLIEEKKYNAAEIEVDKILIKDKNNKNAILRKGEINLFKFKNEYKGDEFLRAEELYPNDPTVLKYLAEYYCNVNNFNLAINTIDKAIKLSSDDPYFVHLKACYLFEKNELLIAEELFNKFITQYPDNRDIHYYQAQFHMSYSEDLEKAESAYSQYLKKSANSDIAEAHYSRAQFYRNYKQNFDFALKDLNDALKLKPNQITFLFERAELYQYEIKNYEKALDDYQKVLSIDSLNFDAIEKIGDIYSKEGDFELARKYFEKLVRMETRFPKIGAIGHVGIANIYLGNQQFDNAVFEYTQAINLDPNNYDNYYYRGDVYREKGDYNAALIDFSKAIESDSTDVDFLTQRAYLYFEFLNDKKNGLKDIHRITKIQQNKINSYYDIALVIEGLQRITGIQEAIKFCDLGIEANLNNNKCASYYYLGKGYCFQKNQNFKDALSNFTTAIRFNENDPLFYLYRGEILLEFLNEIELAIKDFKKSIELKPNYDDALYDLAFAYHEKNEREKENQTLEHLLKINDKHLMGINLLGVNYNLEENYDRAIEIFNKGIKLEKTLPQAAAFCYSNRGGSYAYKGNLNLAKLDFDKAIELDSESSKIYHARALFWRDFINNNDSSYIEICKAIELDSFNIEYLEFRGNYLHSKNKFSESINDFLRIIEIDSLNVNAYNWIGFLFKELNQLDSAEFYYNRAVNLFRNENSGLTELYIGRGDIKCNKGFFDDALKDFNLGLSLSNKLAWPFESRSNLFLEYIGDTLKALEDINSAKKLATINESYVFETSAKLNLKLNNLKVSLDDINQAIKLSQKAENFSRDYLFLKAIILHKQGNKKDAENTLKEIEAIDSLDYSIHICRAKFAIKDGDYATALKNLDLAEKAAPKDPEIYYYKGKCYEIINKSLNSSVNYSKTISCIDGDFHFLDFNNSEIPKSEIYYQIGKFYENNNEFDLMCQYYKISKNLIKEIHKIHNKVILKDIDSKLKQYCQN
jgi:tetratricopeptide (TPR) repeat protein